MSQPAVVFDHVWKRFRRGERHNSLRDLIPAVTRRLLSRDRAAGLRSGDFWALQDVSFEAREGEALGIIGPNGAGKSTVLKLLTKILKPTAGRCALRGRVGALIEVASGFHPDLTGRENVFLQGAIMGMKRAEIVQKFDEIVEFAGTSEFLDTPVKRYSSGTNARLGFSIAAHLNPDVLVIDEILSVGDATFQERCLDRMRSLVSTGMPIVFVSHNLPAVLQLCTRVIVLDHGRILFDGAPAEGVREYQRAPWATREPHAERRRHDGAISITGVRLLDQQESPTDVFRTMGSMDVRIMYDAVRPVARPHFGVEIVSADGTICCHVNTLMDRRDFGVVSGAGHVDLVIPRLSLLPGCYLLSIEILDPACVVHLDQHERAYPFSVISDRRERGLVYMEHGWSHEPAPGRGEPGAAGVSGDTRREAPAERVEMLA